MKETRTNGKKRGVIKCKGQRRQREWKKWGKKMKWQKEISQEEEVKQCCCCFSCSVTPSLPDWQVHESRDILGHLESTLNKNVQRKNEDVSRFSAPTEKSLTTGQAVFRLTVHTCKVPSAFVHWLLKTGAQHALSEGPAAAQCSVAYSWLYVPPTTSVK